MSYLATDVSGDVKRRPKEAFLKVRSDQGAPCARLIGEDWNLELLHTWVVA